MTTSSPSDESVEALMTTEVLCVHETDPVPEAVRMLVERGVDGAPVVDGDNRIVGMISASDVIVQGAQVHLPTIIALFGVSMELPGEARRYEHDLRQALASTVGELMVRDPITITPDATIADAATRMHDHDVSRLPVTDDAGHVVGIIARGDVLRYLVSTGASGD